MKLKKHVVIIEDYAMLRSAIEDELQAYFSKPESELEIVPTFWTSELSAYDALLRFESEGKVVDLFVVDFGLRWSEDLRTDLPEEVAKGDLYDAGPRVIRRIKTSTHFQNSKILAYSILQDQDVKDKLEMYTISGVEIANKYDDSEFRLCRKIEALLLPPSAPGSPNA